MSNTKFKLPAKNTFHGLTDLHAAVAGVELAALAEGEAVSLVPAQEVLLRQPRNLWNQ